MLAAYVAYWLVDCLVELFVAWHCCYDACAMMHAFNKKQKKILYVLALAYLYGCDPMSVYTMPMYVVCGGKQETISSYLLFKQKMLKHLRLCVHVLHVRLIFFFFLFYFILYFCFCFFFLLKISLY